MSWPLKSPGTWWNHYFVNRISSEPHRYFLAKDHVSLPSNWIVGVNRTSIKQAYCTISLSVEVYQNNSVMLLVPMGSAADVGRVIGWPSYMSATAATGPHSIVCVCAIHIRFSLKTIKKVVRTSYVYEGKIPVQARRHVYIGRWHLLVDHL